MRLQTAQERAQVFAVLFVPVVHLRPLLLDDLGDA
jgi:hypothetical protein